MGSTLAKYQNSYSVEEKTQTHDRLNCQQVDDASLLYLWVTIILCNLGVIDKNLDIVMLSLNARLVTNVHR